MKRVGPAGVPLSECGFLRLAMVLTLKAPASSPTIVAHGLIVDEPAARTTADRPSFYAHCPTAIGPVAAFLIVCFTDEEN
jgi:hypothetical protein